MPIKSLTLRLGGGYDETPVPNGDVRSSRIPDGDRILVSAGLKYHVLGFNSPFLPIHVDTDVELAYLHEFVHDPALTQEEDASGHILNGKYHEHVDVVSAAVIFRYGPKTVAEQTREPKDAKDRSTSGK